MAESKKGLRTKLLLLLAQHGKLGRACNELGLSRQIVWRWRKQDAAFSDGYDAAMRVGNRW